MDTEHIINFYEESEKDYILFSYKGEVSPQVITRLISESENLLIERKESKRITKRICNIVIECLQNLYHHQIDPLQHPNTIKDTHKNMIFIITFKEGNYHIHTGNFMKTKDTVRIKRKIGEINNLSEAEIKENYQSKLATLTQSEKGTAGLGFIDMRRKSGNPLGFKFHQLNEKLSFFCLDITINTL